MQGAGVPAASRPASRRRPAARGPAAGLLVCLALGCGYQFAQGGALPAGAQQLRVAAVKNRTALADAGGLFEAALRDQLSAQGRLSAEDASAPVLEVELTSVLSVPSAFGAAAAPAFRLEAALRLQLRDRAGGVVYEDEATGAEDYLSGVDVIGTEANRRAALRRLAATISREELEKLEIAARMQ